MTQFAKRIKNIKITSVTSRNTHASQAVMTQFLVPKKINITMTPQLFKNHVIELVSKNGLPLSLFKQSGFLGIIGEMAEIFGISLNRENIRNQVIDEASKQKEELKELLKGQLIYLKMDACTRHRVNYFAINVRFVDESNMMVTNKEHYQVFKKILA